MTNQKINRITGLILIAFFITQYVVAQEGLILGEDCKMSIGSCKISVGYIKMKTESSLLGNANLYVETSSIIEKRISGSSIKEVKHLVSIPLSSTSSPNSSIFFGGILSKYNPQQNNWTPISTTTSESLNSNIGYKVRYPFDTATFSCQGAFNYGDYNVILDISAPSFNLIPNPYPSSIDWNLENGWTRTNIAKSIWLWSSAQSNYAVYVDGVSTLDGGPVIQTCQSFFIYTLGVNPKLKMNDHSRLHSDQPFVKKIGSSSNLLRIKAVVDDRQDEIIVRLKSDATELYDTDFDALKMYGDDLSPQLSSLSSDNLELSINSIDQNVDGSIVTIPFFMSNNGEVILEFSGAYSFNSNFPIEFDDLKLGTTLDLHVDSLYSFEYEKSDPSDRFRIRFNRAFGIPVKENHELKAWVSNGKMIISPLSAGVFAGEIEIFNLVGQPVFTLIFSKLGQFEIDPHLMGLHFIRISSNKGVVSLKALF